MRALIEKVAEGGPVFVDTEGTIVGLERRLGPLLLPQQRHWQEVINRFGRPEETRKKAALSELADAIHWQFLYGPGALDHTAGMAMALRHIADRLGLAIELPPIPN